MKYILNFTIVICEITDYSIRFCNAIYIKNTVIGFYKVLCKTNNTILYTKQNKNLARAETRPTRRKLRAQVPACTLWPVCQTKFIAPVSSQFVTRVAFVIPAPCGAGAPLFPLVHLLPHHFPFCFFLSFIGFTYFLLLSIPSLSTRIVPLRFQAGGRRRRPNLGLVFFCV